MFTVQCAPRATGDAHGSGCDDGPRACGETVEERSCVRRSGREQGLPGRACEGRGVRRLWNGEGRDDGEDAGAGAPARMEHRRAEASGAGGNTVAFPAAHGVPSSGSACRPLRSAVLSRGWSPQLRSGTVCAVRNVGKQSVYRADIHGLPLRCRVLYSIAHSHFVPHLLKGEWFVVCGCCLRTQ